jgi:hypothetical protein
MRSMSFRNIVFEERRRPGNGNSNNNNSYQKARLIDFDTATVAGAIENLVFDQFSQSVRGISGQFFSSDEFGSLLSGTLDLVLFDQDGGFNYSLTSGIEPSFLGFISNGSFNRFSLVAQQPTDGSFRYAAVDDLGLAARQAVPEPGAASLSLLALGLMLLAAKRRGH